MTLKFNTNAVFFLIFLGFILTSVNSNAFVEKECFPNYCTLSFHEFYETQDEANQACYDCRLYTGSGGCTAPHPEKQNNIIDSLKNHNKTDSNIEAVCYDGYVFVEPDERWWITRYYGSCPIGTIWDPKKGCVQQDEPKDCKYQAGNPINTATGSKYHTEKISIDNGILDQELKYTSNYLIDPFGNSRKQLLSPGWKFSQQGVILTKQDDNAYLTRLDDKAYLTKQDDNGYIHVFVENGNGRKIKYDLINGQWQSKTENELQLIETNDGWELISPESRDVYTFLSGMDGPALIRTKEFYNGTILSYEYDQYYDDKVKKIIDNFGNYVEVNYNNNYTKILGFTHSDGRAWSLNYDSNNNLHQIVYPDGTVKAFYYEDPNHPYALTGFSRRYDPSELDPNHPTNPVTEADMRFATYEYDSERRVTKEWHHAKGLQGNDIKVEELSIDYDFYPGEPDKRKITNSRGKVSTYEVEQNNGVWKIKSITGPGCSSCSNDNTDFDYDNDGNLISKTQDGVTTTYGNYDAKGQYGYKIEADEQGIGVDERRTDYTYDSRFINKITSISEPSVYGSGNKVTSYVYNDNGQMTSMTESGFKPDGTAISRITTYEYNGSFNQISRIDGPRTGTIDETVYEYYDDKGLEPNNHRRLKKVTGPEGIIERENIQWSSTGKVLSEDRPNGITVTNAYQALTDRLDTVTQSDGVKSIITKFTYLATGHVESVTSNFGTAEASTVTLTYDDALRVTRVTDQMGNYIEYTLDTEGNQEAEKTYDPNGVLKKQITQLFDDYDLVDSMTQSGVSVDYNYQSNGLLDNQVNGENITTDYSYDNLKRLTQISQDYQGTDPATANTETSFTYDAGERVKTVTDARGNVTTYHYDDFGNLITLVSPDSGTTSYSYDEAGNMLTKTDANGITVTMTYDGRGRITAIDYPDNSLDTTYVYDQGINGTGQLTSFTDQSGSTTYSYDAFGQLTGKTQSFLNQSLNLAYVYDNHNRLQNMTYPSGLELVYGYDDLNRVEWIKHKPFQPFGLDKLIISQVSYLPFGPIDGFDYINGINYTASYDDGYRLNNYSYSSASQSGISAIHGYDNNHNITSITREVPAYHQSYDYDALDRLTDDGDIDFGYDELGNRTSEQTTGQSVIDYIYEPNSNRLTHVDSLNPTRSYDNNGNTLSINEGNLQTFTYNQANRMSSYTQGGTTTEYQHNAIGQRVMKWQVQGPNDYIGTAFMYDEQGQLINETSFRNNQGVVTIYWMRETIWLGNKPVAQLHSVPFKNSWVRTLYYIMTDHLNTPRWVTDHSGAILWRWESDAFGTTAPDEDVDGDGTNLTFNLRFPGQYFDVESGLHYNYFRDYEPGVGRYVESDPIGLLGGVNTFGFARNNALKFFDFFGLTVWTCQRPLSDYSGENGSGPPVLNHQFLCVTRADGTVNCNSTNPAEGAFILWPQQGAPSTPEKDNLDNSDCKIRDDNNDYCLESCILKQWEKPRPLYALGPQGVDCQEYTTGILKVCEFSCSDARKEWWLLW